MNNIKSRDLTNKFQFSYFQEYLALLFSQLQLYGPWRCFLESGRLCLALLLDLLGWWQGQTPHGANQNLILIPKLTT